MNKTLWERIFGCRCTTRMRSLLWVQLYSRSSPCDHSRKRPALVTTTFVKPRLNVNFVMKSSRKRPLPYWTWPLFGLPSWTFILILCSRKRPLSLSRINQNFNETAFCVNSLKILVIKSLALSTPDVKTLIDHYWYGEGDIKLFGGRLTFWVCWFEGLWKIGDVKGEGVKSGYKTKGLITWAGQACFAEIAAP